MKKNILTIFLGASIIGFSLTSCCKCDLKYSGVPSKIISVEQAVTMKKEYDSTIAPLIKEAKSTKGEDYNATQYAYIELDSLKKYIAFLDEVQRKNPKQKITGIRIYYAAYPKVRPSNFIINEDLKLGRETFFFAPTMLANNPKLSIEQNKRIYLKNVPFSIKPTNPKKDKYIGDYKIIKDLLNTNDANFELPSTMSTMKSTVVDDTSLIMNDLYVCPPPKSTGTSGS